MRIQTFDTTLRDGSQGEAVSFSVDDKMLIAQKLDELGIDFIEGGWPGSNPRDKEFFEQARGLKLKHAKLTAFGSPSCSTQALPSFRSSARAGTCTFPALSASRKTRTSPSSRRLSGISKITAR